MSDAVPEIITEARSKICDIISEMLDNPDESGIYRTTRAYNKLEAFVADTHRTGRLEMARECLELTNRNYPGVIAHIRNGIQTLIEKETGE